MNVFSSDGVELFVHELGGCGPPVIFMHATGFHGAVWGAVAGHLRAEYRCLAIDERGHGRSGLPPNGSLDWSGFANDALAAVDSLDTQLPYGVGHSSGATALLMAEQARPGTFGALYCFEPIIVLAETALGRDRRNWLAEVARQRRDTFGSRQEAYERYLSKPPLSSVDPGILRAYVKHGFEDLDDGRVRLRCRPGIEALAYEMASANDCFSRLATVECPVALVSGTASEAWRPTAMEAVATRLGAARTAQLPGLGHLGPMEDPTAVARSIATFFDDVAHAV